MSILLRNARIWTGSAQQPWAEAALVDDGRFVFVGRERDATAPDDTRTLDARGRLVVPGFVDAHAHLLGTGLAMQSVDLRESASAADAARRVADAGTVSGGWLRGEGWDQNAWPGATFPTRHDLDAAVGERPAVLTHTSRHCIWVNTAALRAAEITRETPAPEGGSIDRDDAGEPAGILRDAAAQLVWDAVPPPSTEERSAAIRAAIRHAHALGLTGVHAMDVRRGELEALRALHREGELSLRVHAFLSASRLDRWIDEGLRTGDGDEMLRIGGVKFFADGALGSLTAWMLEPYEGTADVGLPLQEPEMLEQQVRRALDNGLAPAVHAIGDRANREVLGIFDRLSSVGYLPPGRTSGFTRYLHRRIEHAQLLSPADLPRFARLGVIASVQPIHATQDMAKVDRAWGSRGVDAYPFASLLRAGVPLAFGSDSPVETMDPIAGIHAAVTRRNAGGKPPGGWYPEQRVSLEAALHAYSNGCAAAVADGESGSIAAGQRGDFVVLSDDLFALPDPMDILRAHVVTTVVGGEVVHDAV